MSFSFEYSNELKYTLKKIVRKNKPLYLATLKKIDEIINRDVESIDYYKNLRNDLNEYKRVHVLKHYVLLFKIYKETNKIYFQKIRHHDEAYKQK
jgi:mRNA-degrading endonuclease RelE of RelBE toxin-antitoxin system